MTNRHCRNRANNSSFCQVYSIDMSHYSGTLFRSDRVHTVHFRSNTKFIEHSPAAASLTFTRRKFWSTIFTDATATMMSKSKQKCAERLRPKGESQSLPVKLLLRKVLKIFHATSQQANAISAPITKLRELRSVQTSDVQFLFTENVWKQALNVKQEKINLAGKQQWNCKLLP